MSANSSKDQSSNVMAKNEEIDFKIEHKVIPTKFENDQADEKDHNDSFKSSDMPFIEIKDLLDTTSFFRQMNHMTYFKKESLDNVPIAKYLPDKQIQNVKGASVIGIKLKPYDKVIAYIEEPQIYTEKEFKVLKAGKLYITNDIRRKVSEELDFKDVVPFSIDDPEHDMSTFSGRFDSFVGVSNIFRAFYGNSKICQFLKLIEDQKENE